MTDHHPQGPTGKTPHQIATELSDIRREIARLQKREALLIAGQTDEGRRPGWPITRLAPPQREALKMPLLLTSPLPGFEARP
jgi:hypothetical protein